MYFLPADKVKRLIARDDGFVNGYYRINKERASKSVLHNQAHWQRNKIWPCLLLLLIITMAYVGLQQHKGSIDHYNTTTYK